MRWSTFETEDERPPLRVWTRADLDHAANAMYDARRTRESRNNRPLDRQEQRDIARAYREGATIEELKQDFNRHFKTIRKALSAEGVTLRRRGGAQRGRGPERATADR